MRKDKKARRANEMTVVALGNLVAVIVDTMRNAQVPNEVVHHFIDELADLNAITLNGEAADFMAYIANVLRGSVPVND